MLSLPLIPPQPDPLRTHFRPRADSPPPLPPSNPHHQQQTHHQQAAHRAQQRRDEERKLHNARAPLTLLLADEHAIAQRKAAIRNFGAYWIRPPGVSKTLQAMREEMAEMAEQEELLRQEQNMRDLQARQEVEEARTRAEQGGGGEEGAQEERDLDEEIPDADQEQEAEGTESEVDEEEEEGEEEDVTFNEESMVEGSRFVTMEEAQLVEQQEQYAQLEEAELTGAAQDEADLGVEHHAVEMAEERNLDDSIPEAGSYQHTDTEVEDSDSDPDSSSLMLQDSFAAQSARRSLRSSGTGVSASAMTNRGQGPAARGEGGGGGGRPDAGSLPTGLQERLRAQTTAMQLVDPLVRSPGSMNLSSSLLESSFVGSSPVMQRASGQQARRGRGAGRRGRGRLS